MLSAFMHSFLGYEIKMYSCTSDTLNVLCTKGSSTSISNALRTVLEAVWRYKYLAEGPCAGERCTL